MKIILGIGLVLLLILGHEAYRVYRAFALARPIIDSAVPFTQKGGGMRYLFVGESTGVGTGATRPEESVAGRLGSAQLSAHVDNVSENGAKITDALKQISALPQDVSYDVVILQIGGNDILNFTSPKNVREAITELMTSAKARAGYVYLMTTGDVGNAPAFGPVLSWLYSLRSRELREVFVEESKRAGVIYVDLFTPRAKDPFALEPLKYHAGDGVHPSSEGYGVWYGKLRNHLK